MKSNQPRANRALSEAQQALLDDLRYLGHLIHVPSDASVAEVRQHLNTAYTHLCLHFRLEEQGGYFNNVQEMKPRLERALCELVAQHHELRRSLDSLRAEAARATAIDDAMRGKIRAWIDRFLAHETRENDVAQDAVDLDLGAGD
jgi:Hemerythrin HHE cation binding domain